MSSVDTVARLALLVRTAACSGDEVGAQEASERLQDALCQCSPDEFAHICATVPPRVWCSGDE